MRGSAWLGVYLRLATLLLPVICCAAVGAAWAIKKKAYPAEFVATLATVVSTPALVFYTLMTTRLDGAQLLEAGAASLLGLAVAGVLSGVALRSMQMPATTLGPAATFPNAGNLGLPIAQFAFGDSGLAVALAFFAINSVMQHTLGVWVTSRGVDRAARWPKGVIVACLLAVAFRTLRIELPDPVIESARLVGSLAVPLMLLSLGHALASVSRAGIRQGALLGAIRLVVGVLAGALVVHALRLPPLVAGVLTLQLAMPVAVVSSIYVQRYSNHGDEAAGAVLVSTAAFFVLCPLLIWFADTSRF
ncbi:AEC family transporter [Variovorax sp. J22R133]|uniref:AEC family transporter n=1 Tax=Variovorax brevis TaxID=3053503 RepID=UPI002577FB75|nr:AEC family transporter [Variovorax sp. J22R133]MDM0116414.1 AEC family transporter [Variovorax sp. J22R133]